jgi:hypothetical protein
VAAVHAVAPRSWPLVAPGAGGGRTESAPQIQEIRNGYDTWDPPAQSDKESSILKSLLDLINFLLATSFYIIGKLKILVSDF